jgi:histone H4
MAGKGKLGKQASKGKAKRIAKKTVPSRADSIQVTKGALRRLARRGGVKRISSNSYTSVREFCDQMVSRVTRDSIVYAESAKRRTVTAMDVVYALKKNGKTLYGYGA